MQNELYSVYNSTVNATSNSINLTCEAVIASGSGSGFTVSQLKALSLDDIRDCLYELGYSPLDSDQATTIWNRVLAVYGSANNIPKDQLVLLGWILAGVDTTSYLSSKDSNRDHNDTTQYLNPLFTSTADLQLRFLCPSDLDQVKELCKEWFPIQYPETWYRDITSDPRFYSLAAVYQSNLVGLLIAEVKRTDTINKEDKGILDTRMYSNCTVGYILSLGVCSSFRRQGVASLLLDSFLTHVTQIENQICKAIYLHVLTMNSAAIRFYEKHYFRLHSFLPYYYSVDGKCKDGFTYVLYINGGHPPWGLLYPFQKQKCSITYFIY
uniref:N-alpha-acetyltransferase 60 n=1 Tax=Megafenestra aurita TaxID=2291010 RepID=A0A4Y7NJ37_9CRUS|nr:EOG090X0BM0 [Megafenestra aurita]SVE92597.1 EOG090X0BM0 [Megafenestra aurita]